MRDKRSKRLYRIPLDFGNGLVRTVSVRAKSREVAEARALKFNSKAIGVKRDA